MSGELLQMTPVLYDYLESVSPRERPELKALREESEKNPRHNMAVSPMQGRFMGVLVKALGARKIVEVGVFTGYSSLAMALSLPKDGQLWCFDVSDEWTAVARKHWERAGVADRIDFRLTTGEEGLRGLIEAGHAGKIDLVFVDADKENYPTYWDLAHTLLRDGGLAIADNTLFQSAVGPDQTDDKLRARWEHRGPEIQEMLVSSVHAVRAFNERVRDDDRFETSMIPVGDGMTFGVKL